MATLPAYTCLEVNGYGESFDPSVERVEMERGPTKERLLNSRVNMKLRGSLLFKSVADTVAFENWYFNTIKRIGSFDMEHPRTGQIISGKFEGGSIGTLVPVNNRRAKWRRDVTIEYMR